MKIQNKLVKLSDKLRERSKLSKNYYKLCLFLNEERYLLDNFEKSYKLYIQLVDNGQFDYTNYDNYLKLITFSENQIKYLEKCFNCF